MAGAQFSFHKNLHFEIAALNDRGGHICTSRARTCPSHCGQHANGGA